jgi:hypothetical protein
MLQRGRWGKVGGNGSGCCCIFFVEHGSQFGVIVDTPDSRRRAAIQCVAVFSSELLSRSVRLKDPLSLDSPHPSLIISPILGFMINSF